MRTDIQCNQKSIYAILQTRLKLNFRANKFQITDPNIIKFNKYLWFLSEVMISVRSDHCYCNYPVSQARPLATPLTYLINHLFIYSMEQSPSWEANQFAASKEIPHI